MAKESPLTLQELETHFRRCEETLTDQPPGELLKFTVPSQYKALVLPRELEALRSRAGSTEPSRPELLVLLCGTSPAPLLLSFAYHRPAKVLLVGSHSPEEQRKNTAMLDQVRACLPGEVLTPDLYIHESEPIRAYEELYLHLRGKDSRSVLLDLTGGKKTMTIAAFLVAARLSLRITYVDAHRYSDALRLPWPGESYVRQVKDPVTVFKLHELRQASELFRAHRFDAAERLYQEIAASLEATGFTLLTQPSQVRRAAALARAVAAWREANYPTAESEFQAAGVPVPSQVLALARLWSTYQDEDERHRLLSIKQKGEGLVRFAADRLAWALRQHPHDLRGSFLAGFQSCDMALEGLCMSLAQRNIWPSRTSIPSRHCNTCQCTLQPKPAPAPGSRSGQSLLQEAQRDGLLSAGFAGFPGLGDAYLRFSGSAPASGSGGGKAGKEELRDHRNILIHRIGSPKKALADKLLSGAPTLAEKLLRAIGAALPLGSSSADAIISDALADLPLSTIQGALPAE